MYDDVESLFAASLSPEEQDIWLNTYGPHAAPYIWAHQAGIRVLPPGFASLPADDLETWFSVYGPQAPDIWQQQSQANAAGQTPIGQAGPAPTPGMTPPSPVGSPGSPGGYPADGWNMGMVLPQYRAAIGTAAMPGYISGNADYNHWRLDQPGLIGTVGGVPNLNLRYGEGGPGDPTNGSEPVAPEQWMNGDKLFLNRKYERKHENLEGPVANLFLRADTPSGLGGVSWSAPEAYWQELYNSIASGDVEPTQRGWQFLQQVKGMTPAKIGGAGAQAAAAAGIGTNGAGSPNGLGLPEGSNLTLGGTDFGAIKNGLPGGAGLQWWQLALQNAVARGTLAVQQAATTGAFGQNPDGTPVMPRIVNGHIDLNDTRLTLQARRQAEEILSSEAARATQEAALTGIFRRADGTTVQTLPYQQFLESQRQFNAQFGENQYQFDVNQAFKERQEQAAALADPNRFVEGAYWANLNGSAKNGQPIPFVEGSQQAGQPVNYALGNPGQAPSQRPSVQGTGNWVYDVVWDAGQNRFVPVRRDPQAGIPNQLVPDNDMSAGAQAARQSTSQPYGSFDTPQERAFVWTGWGEGPAVQMFGRQDSRDGTGISGDTENTPEAKQQLLSGLQSGLIKVNSAYGASVAAKIAQELGQTLPQSIYGNFVANPDAVKPSYVSGLGRPGQAPGQAPPSNNPELTIAPELNAFLQDKTVSPFGNPSGVPGAFMRLRQAVPKSGSFLQVDPFKYKQLSNTARAQYGSIAQADSGIRPADLQQGIMGQLPGRQSGVPGAFASF